MPVIESDFKPSFLFRNPHLSTVHASLLRWIPRVKFERERVDTPDGDFLDLDWKKGGSKNLVLILPGLEGKSNSLYSRAVIRYFTKRGWDALGMNYRGCSGSKNRKLRGYHMGASDDVSFVVDHAINHHQYDNILLVGYSLGGNLALKYAGEMGKQLPPQVKSAVAFSAPMDIKASDERLNKWYNYQYLKWFMFPLNVKARQKMRQFPGKLNYKGFLFGKNFVYFDTHFTAPANGYSTVEEYWEKSSCLAHLPNVEIPVLVVSSLNDTFISKNCYPVELARNHKNIYLEMPKYGGHCGFIKRYFEQEYWMEERAYQFVTEHLDKSKKTQNHPGIVNNQSIVGK